MSSWIDSLFNYKANIEVSKIMNISSWWVDMNVFRKNIVSWNSNDSRVEEKIVRLKNSNRWLFNSNRMKLISCKWK